LPARLCGDALPVGLTERYIGAAGLLASKRGAALICRLEDIPLVLLLIADFRTILLFATANVEKNLRDYLRIKKALI
jgi:hypothetical protein